MSPRSPVNSSWVKFCKYFNLNVCVVQQRSRGGGQPLVTSAYIASGQGTDFYTYTSNLCDKIKTEEYSEWELLELKIIYLIVECLLH